MKRLLFLLLIPACAVTPPAEIQAVADLSAQALGHVAQYGAVPGDPALQGAASASTTAARYLGPPPDAARLVFVPGEPPALATPPPGISQQEADRLAAELLAKADELANAEAKKRALEAKLKDAVENPVEVVRTVIEESGLPAWLQALLGIGITVAASYFGLEARRKSKIAGGMLGALIDVGNQMIQRTQDADPRSSAERAQFFKRTVLRPIMERNGVEALVSAALSKSSPKKDQT